MHSSPPTPGAGDPWFRALVEQSQDILTVVGGDGRILYDSPAVTRLLGYAQGELVGRNALELVHADDLRGAFHLLLHTVATPGTTSSLVFRFRHRDGRWRFLESVGTPFAHPQTPSVLITSRDVTDQIHTTRALRDAHRELEEHVRTQALEIEEARLEMLQRLARAAELRDDDTGEHIRRVGELAAGLADAIGLTDGQVELVRRTAPLHDVGKIGIPDAILRKRASLSPQEQAVMRSHTVLGARILGGSRSPLLHLAEEIALCHHERWDGTGYPEGRRREAIPLAARIVAVADFFDALTHDRVYRPAQPRALVLQAIRQAAGTHFDPLLADAFLQLQSRSPDPRAVADPPGAAAAGKMQ